jgi:hypothetical protein
MSGPTAFDRTSENGDGIMNAKHYFLMVVVAGVSIIAIYTTITGGLSLLSTKDPKTPQPLAFVLEPTEKKGDVASHKRLDISSPDKKTCQGKRPQGCFKIFKNRTGMLHYKLKQSAIDDHWVLTRLTICPGTTEITDTCGVNVSLTLDERLEFFAMDDKTGTEILITPANGQIDLAGDLSATLTEFYLRDQNTIQRKYFYNIQACKGVDCRWIIDPPVDNDGRPGI